MAEGRESNMQKSEAPAAVAAGVGLANPRTPAGDGFANRDGRKMGTPEGDGFAKSTGCSDAGFSDRCGNLISLFFLFR
jgi:hypothetical protein